MTIALKSQAAFCRTLRVAAAMSALAIALPAQANGWNSQRSYMPVHAPSAHALAPMSTSSMSVDVNRTHVLRLAQPASAVVVGNPTIADIAVHTTDTILVLGRNYGSTNIIAFDAAGNIMAETTVMVGETPTDSRLRVYEGSTVRKTYECTHDCVPTPTVGDDPAFRGLNTGATPAPVSDTVVSRAGSDFGDVAGRPFAATPSQMPAPAFTPPAFTPPAFSPPAGLNSTGSEAPQFDTSSNETLN